MKTIKPMKYIITILCLSCCLFSIDSFACPAYVPYISGAEEVQVNTTSMPYTHVFESGYSNAQGGYMGTEWSLSSVGIIGYGTSINVSFSGLPTGTYTLTAADKFANQNWCYGCISNTTFTLSIVVFPTFTKPVFGTGGGDSNSRWISWSTIPYAYSYVFESSKFSNFSPIWQSKEPTTASSGDIDVFWCETIYFRVRARSIAGQLGPWSDTFTWGPGAGCRMRAPDAPLVEPVSAPEESFVAEDAAELTVFPNPSERFFNVTLPAEMDVQNVGVSVRNVSCMESMLPYSITGRKLEVDASGAASGLYLLTISDGKRRLTLKALRR